MLLESCVARMRDLMSLHLLTPFCWRCLTSDIRFRQPPSEPPVASLQIAVKASSGSNWAVLTALHSAAYAPELRVSPDPHPAWPQASY
jgi:hypothetical protein